MTTIAFKELTMEGADFANPRVHIDAKAVTELAGSIQQHGLLYPLCVWKTKNEKGTALNVVVDGGRRVEVHSQGSAVQSPVAVVAKRAEERLGLAVEHVLVRDASPPEQVLAEEGVAGRLDLGNARRARPDG